MHMATVVFFHAHPDDEAMLTAGTMAALAGVGHRVVLVTATKGEHGEIVQDVLDEGEQLADRRVRELAAAAAVLNVARVEYLGYVDSGMMGTVTNEAADAFWQADVDLAAERLAGILKEEQAGVLVVYDDHGSYGHPDHIQVHRVGVRAAEFAATPVVYEAVMDRDRMNAQIEIAREAGGPDLPDPAEEPPEEFGVPAHLITTRVDVMSWTGIKRQAMACHRSQIRDDSFLFTLPDKWFGMTFGTEEYIRRDAPPGTVEAALDIPG
jgi:LmbE family N-acetylglucosaminyl deacetylase